MKCLSRIRQRIPTFTKQNQFQSPETWYEPHDYETYFIENQDPGPGRFHPVSEIQIHDRLSSINAKYKYNLSWVIRAGVTRKKSYFPLYGMAWGESLYLYSVSWDLSDLYEDLPETSFVSATKKYGGKWTRENGEYRLRWTEKTIRDFYLEDILLHELGHINDQRNTSYREREAFANHFAIKHGRPTTKKKKAKKRHNK